MKKNNTLKVIENNIYWNLKNIESVDKVVEANNIEYGNIEDRNIEDRNIEFDVK